MPSLAALPFLPRSALTWADVLPSPCVVLLGEAGSGKTSELRAQAERLVGEGRTAFFLRVEALAKDDLTTAVEGDLDELEQWIHGSTEGWLFLDSVDEAKLHGESLQRALAKLQKELRSALSRCHVVVSCRHSDWHAEDETTLQRFADKLVKLPDVPSEKALRARRAPSTRSPRLGHNRPQSTASVRLLRLASLSRNQIRTYAEQGVGVTDADSFVASLGQSNLWGLAGRPLDVEWLALSWKRKGAFGSLRKMLEEGIREKLQERRDATLFRAPISLDQAREGVERIALALTMTGHEAVTLPSASAESPGRALDIRSILSRWTDDQISCLLRMPVFDPATYGRVRFHHRMVREYLAASCLLHLRQQGLLSHQLDHLLFATVEGRSFARPGFEAVVAWLAIDDLDVRRRAVALAPEHLIDLGDPSELPPDVRREVLRSYARRFAGRKRTLHTFDRAGLERFAREDLAPVIRELLSPDISDDLRGALLEMIRRKKLDVLADAALNVATENVIPPFLRREAIRSVAAAGTLEQKRTLANQLIPQFAAERNTAGGLLEELFPDVLTVDQVVAIVEIADARSSFVDPYHRILARIGAACPPELQADLLLKLVALFERLCAEKGAGVGKHLEWAPLVVGLLDSILRSGGLVPQLATCLRILKEAGRGGAYESVELDQLLTESLSLRRAAFWDAVEQWRSAHGQRPRYAHQAWPYDVFNPTLVDADWLERDTIADTDPWKLNLAFDGLQLVLDERRSEGNNRDRIARVASERPEFGEHLRRRMNPPLPKNEELEGAYKIAWMYRRRLWQEQRNKKKELTALRRELPRIRSGDAVKALFRLYKVGRRQDETEWLPEAVAETYGSDLAEAAAEGFRAIWNKQTMPPGRHEVEAGSIPYVCVLGAFGLELEIRQGLNVAQLDEVRLRKAITYAQWSRGDFPVLLDGCVERSPMLVRELFDPSLRLDYDSDDGGRLLRRLANASEPVRAACAPLLIDLLQISDPPHDRTLALILLAMHGLSAHSARLNALCRPRCEASIECPERFAMWWKTWLALDMRAAVGFLDDQVFEQKPCDITDRCVVACIGEDDRQWEIILALLRQNVKMLLQFLIVVLRHVRFNEDIEDVHADRYDAQEFRGRLLRAVVETGAVEAIRTLDRLATQPRDNDKSPDRLRLAADECAHRAATKQWLLHDVTRFLDHCVLAPRTSSDLFEITVNVVIDIQRFIEQGDSSVRAAYCRSDRDDLDEIQFQVFLRNELERRSSGRYSVTREDELADGTKPDLRIWVSGMGPVSVEVKIAERWTLNDLESTLPNQLVGQYMKDQAARHGVLVLVSAGKAKTWGVGAQRIERFRDLILHLQKRAEALQAQGADVEGLLVVGIDFHEPRPATIPPATSPGTKKLATSTSKGTGKSTKKPVT